MAHNILMILSFLFPITAAGYDELLYLPRFWCALVLLPLNAICPYILALYVKPAAFIGSNRRRPFAYLLIA